MIWKENIKYQRNLVECWDEWSEDVKKWRNEDVGFVKKHEKHQFLWSDCGDAVAMLNKRNKAEFASRLLSQSV